MADPFAPLPGARQTDRLGAKSAEWVPLVPVPANAPAPPTTDAEFGNPTATWIYRDQGERLLGAVCRFDGGDRDKQFRR